MNYEATEKNKNKMNFDHVTPLYPDEQSRLETEKPSKDASARVIDLVSPIGKGQRIVIVSYSMNYGVQK